MATVKSLEERIDDLADEFAGVKTQLSVLTTKVDLTANAVATGQAQQTALTNQLAVLAARFDALGDRLEGTNTRLDGIVGKLDGVVTEHTALKAKSDATLAIVRWIGGFTAGVVVMVILSGFTVARSAGRLEEAVQFHQKSLDQQQKTLDEIRREVTEIRAKQK